MGNKGYIQLVKGEYVGELVIDGVDISPITGFFFKDKGTQWLWIKRKRLLEYDFETNEFRTKNPTPQFEAYLKKQNNGRVAYQGNFIFFKFKYLITAIWEDGNKKGKLELFVERLPNEQQNILNNIRNINNER